MTRIKLIGLVLAMMPVIVLAQSPLDEEKALIKSWGLQFDGSGYLKFTASEVHKDVPRDHWNPDLSAYYPEAAKQQTTDSLAPLVVSAKNAK